MRTAIWLLIILVFTIAVSLVFTKYISEFQREHPEKEGFYPLLLIMAEVDRGLNNACRNKMNDKSKTWSDTNATSGERDVCNGRMFQHYPSSDDTVKRWSKSKKEQIDNAFERAGVTFATTGDDIDFLLNFFKDKYNFDILTYPYDGNMNKFYELVQNIKKDPKIKSFKQYLDENNQVQTDAEAKAGFTPMVESFSGKMTNIGCYNDKPDSIKGDRAIKNYMGYVTNDAAGSAASKCADKAVANNSRVFGLQWRNGNNMQCFVGDGKDDEIVKSKAYGVSTADCTKNQVPLQNNVFILPLGPQKYNQQQTFALYGSRPDVQKKFGIDPADYSKILAKKTEIDAALQPTTEGLEVMASNESDKTKYVGVSNRERGGATTWNTFNVSDKTLGKEAVDGCKKVCDSNSECGAVVVQKREGPWDCWTIPKKNINDTISPKKENAAQATYYKTDNIVCANDATCGFAEPFQENFNYGSVISNKDFPGNDIGGPTKVTDANGCKTRCDGVTNCKGFVLDKRANPANCWLKSVVPPQVTGLPTVNNIDTYAVIPGVASSAAKLGPIAKSSKSIADVSVQNSRVIIPPSKTLKPGDFNSVVSDINDDIKITTSISTLLNGLQDNGVSLQGFTTIEGLEVQTTTDSSARMGASTDIEVLEIVNEINNRYGNPDKTTAILADLGVKYGKMSESLNTISTFGINSGDSLTRYFEASKGPLQQIGIRPSFAIIDAMNNYKLTYADVMDSSFVSKMQGLGFKENSDFAGILNAMVNFKINSTNLPKFRAISGMQNINELPDYTSAMAAFGISTYNANHDEIVKVASAFKTDFPDATRIPSLVHTQKVLKLLTDAEISNYTTYKSFRDNMSKQFDKYNDDAEFRVSFTQFGTFKNRGSDNKGRLRKSEIDRIVTRLSSCGYFNSSNKVSFSELINSLTSQNMRLYVAGDQTNKFMVFDADACSFMRNFRGNQSNFGKEKQGFTGQIQGFMKDIFKPSPESFTNAYSIAKSFGISNPVQAVAHADDPAKFYSEPDFYTKIRSFGIDSVSKYDNLVKVFTKFGSSNTTFCKVVAKLKVFGVPSGEYVSFVEALTKINVTYPYFEKFIDRIMDFGVVYQANVEPAKNLYYRFLRSVNAFGITFTPPDANGNNTFYRFLHYMKSVGLAVGYPRSPYPCKGLKQPNNAFFHAMITFVKLGYTSETFFQESEGRISTTQMLDIIRKYDCQLLDFSTPKLSNLLVNSEPIVKMASNMGIPDKDKYLKYYSGIFVGKVPNKFPIIPNVVFSFMQDENYKIKATLIHENYTSIANLMNDHITKTYMDGKNVPEARKNEYETYMLNMNTLRLFPNFVAAFIKDVSTNTQNPYNASFSDESQDINPNKQRGCTRFMKIALNAEQMEQCPP